MSVKCARSLVITGVLILTSMTACASSPTTKAEVCSSFNDLGVQFLKGNGILGNPLFHQISDTGDIAKRYPDAGVQSDGDELGKLGDAESLTGFDLMNATTHIADLCGHPLGIH